MTPRMTLSDVNILAVTWNSRTCLAFSELETSGQFAMRFHRRQLPPLWPVTTRR
jgi:hypothetical protein